MGSIEIEALAPPFHEMVDFLDRTVVDTDMEPFALHVEGQVLTHNRQTYKSDV
jgi:hypothetical protein